MGLLIPETFLRPVFKWSSYSFGPAHLRTDQNGGHFEQIVWFSNGISIPNQFSDIISDTVPKPNIYQIDTKITGPVRVHYLGFTVPDSDDG